MNKGVKLAENHQGRFDKLRSKLSKMEKLEFQQTIQRVVFNYMFGVLDIAPINRVETLLTQWEKKYEQ